MPSTSWARSGSATVSRLAKPVPGPQPDQERLGAEHLVGYPVGHGNQAAGYGHIDAPADQGVGHRGQPHPLQVHGHLQSLSREPAGQKRGEHRGHGRVIPTRTVPASPATTRRTAASAAATSSRMTFDRASLGFAILGTILITEFRDKITSSLTGRGLPHAAAATEASKIAQLQGGDGNVAAIPAFVRADFALAIRSVLYTMALIMAVAGVVALLGLRRGVQEDTEAPKTEPARRQPGDDPPGAEPTGCPSGSVPREGHPHPAVNHRPRAAARSSSPAR